MAVHFEISLLHCIVIVLSKYQNNNIKQNYATQQQTCYFVCGHNPNRIKLIQIQFALFNCMSCLVAWKTNKILVQHLRQNASSDPSSHSWVPLHLELFPMQMCVDLHSKLPSLVQFAARKYVEITISKIGGGGLGAHSCPQWKVESFTFIFDIGRYSFYSWGQRNCEPHSPTKDWIIQLNLYTRYICIK